MLEMREMRMRVPRLRVWMLPPFRLSVVLGMALGVVLSTAAAAAPGPCTVDPGLPDPLEVEIDTSLGPIAVELWPDVAPCTVNNFLAYLESGRYDGTFVHRTVDGFVVQAGGYGYDADIDTFSSIPRDPPVVNEPGESNLRGTIAMARVGGQVNSATSEFFINLADTNSFLDTVDQGFTVFGAVVPPDMNVVDAISTLPRVRGSWALDSPLREVFAELPVLTAPIDPPGGYGCFDVSELPQTTEAGWLRALVNVAKSGLEPDPLTGGVYYLSASCDGSGATGPPSVACPAERDVAFSSSGLWYLTNSPMTCAAIAESEESLAARRDHLHPQVTADLVEIASIRVVPEPGETVMLLAGLLALRGLARRRG